MHGNGKYFFGDTGRIFMGQFRNNNQHGKGILLQPGEWIYQGAFKDSMMSGQGVLEYQNGDAYEGQFKKDKFDGKAIWYSFKE